MLGINILILVVNHEREKFQCRSSRYVAQKTNAVAALPLKNGRLGIVFTYKLLTNLAASMCIFGTRTAGLIQDTDSRARTSIGQARGRQDAQDGDINKENISFLTVFIYFYLLQTAFNLPKHLNTTSDFLT